MNLSVLKLDEKVIQGRLAEDLKQTNTLALKANLGICERHVKLSLEKEERIKLKDTDIQARREKLDVLLKDLATTPLVLQLQERCKIDGITMRLSPPWVQSYISSTSWAMNELVLTENGPRIMRRVGPDRGGSYVGQEAFHERMFPFNRWLTLQSSTMANQGITSNDINKRLLDLYSEFSTNSVRDWSPSEKALLQDKEFIAGLHYCYPQKIECEEKCYLHQDGEKRRILVASDIGMMIGSNMSRLQENVKELKELKMVYAADVIGLHVVGTYQYGISRNEYVLAKVLS